MTGVVGQRERVIIDTKDGLVVARKRAQSPAELERLRREAAVLERLDHPGVVRLLEARDRDGEVELVTQWVGHHSLATSHVQPPSVVAVTIAAVADTLADVHEQGVVHTRVEPAHVLLGPRGPVLCGFADAEVIEGPGRAHERATIDVCAVGHLLGHMLEPGDDLEPIPERRLTRPGARRWDGYGRRALLTLADQATADDPSHRPSMRALAHAVREAGAPRPPRAKRIRDGGRAWLGAHQRPVAGALVAGVLVATGAVVVTGLVHRSQRTTPSASCVSGSAVGIDVDGDGCPEDVEIDPDGSVRAGDTTYEIAEAGDAVALGDWDCDGIDTPAVLRPSTGQIFWYSGWAAPGEPVRAQEADSPPSTRDIESARRGSCDELVAIGANGSRTTVITEES